MEVRETRIPLYKCRMHIVLTDSAEELLSYLEQASGMPPPKEDFESDDDIYAHVLNGSFKEREKCYHDCIYVVFNDKALTPLSHGVIAHEALHVLNSQISKVNIDYDVVNDEPFTYLLEWIVNELTQFLSEHKAVIKI